MTARRVDRPRDIVRTWAFWLLFLASVLSGVTNSASTPIIPAYVDEVLGGGSAVAGLVVALAGVASIVSMPLSGSLADRRGYRLIGVVGGVLGVVGLVLLAVLPSLWGAGLSRVLFGFGNAAAATIVMAWLIALSPPSQRGRALSFFGLSVWLGLAIGPQIGIAVERLGGPATVFTVCAVIELGTVAAILLLPKPRRGGAVEPTSAEPTTADAPSPPDPDAAAPPRAAAFWPALRTVWPPGVAAAAAWCGEGMMIAFLITHLVAAGVPSGGLTGAASVYSVFAVSVVLARLAFATMPDRIGPLRAATVAMTCLAIGLAVTAVAHDFWVAAAGACFIGLGFAPLYPSLTMLATGSLPRHAQATGLGLFSGMTSVGYASGALLGGLLIAVASSAAAFLVIAALQFVAIAVLWLTRRAGVSPVPAAQPT